jgi:hypothetical protein
MSFKINIYWRSRVGQHSEVTAGACAPPSPQHGFDDSRPSIVGRIAFAVRTGRQLKACHAHDRGLKNASHIPHL